LEGSIIAGTAITVGAEAVLHGCTLARTAITLEASASIDSPANAIAAATALSDQAANPVTLSFDNVCGVDYAVQAGTALTFGASTSVQGGNVGYGYAIAGTSDLDDGKLPKSGIDSSVLSTNHTALMAERDGSEPLLGAIGGLTFTPGTYRSTAAVATAAATVVTLDGQDRVNPIFLFQAGTLGMGAGSSTFLINGAETKNVFWVVNTVAALGANTFLKGSIIAGTTITLGAEALSHGYTIAGTTVTLGASVSVNAASLRAETSPGSLTFGNVCREYAVQAGTAVAFGAATTIHGGVVGYGSAIAGSSDLKDGAALMSTSKIASVDSVTKHAEAMAERADSFVLPGTIGGLTFGPGTYRSIAAVTTAAASVVTLQGGEGDVFIFQASTLSIGANTNIHLTGGVKAENVFWAVDTTAVLGANSFFAGSIIAGTAITLGADAMVHGCTLAGTAVTLGAGASIDVTDHAVATASSVRHLRGWKK
jgi:fibronectin-binding autotransporter adhesin